jgi:hypothetical protein
LQPLSLDEIFAQQRFDLEPPGKPGQPTALQLRPKITPNDLGMQVQKWACRSQRDLRLEIRHTFAADTATFTLVADSVFQFPDLERGQEEALGAGKRADRGTNFFLIDIDRSALSRAAGGFGPVLPTRPNRCLALLKMTAWT